MSTAKAVWRWTCRITLAVLTVIGLVNLLWVMLTTAQPTGHEMLGAILWIAVPGAVICIYAAIKRAGVRWALTGLGYFYGGTLTFFGYDYVYEAIARSL